MKTRKSELTVLTPKREPAPDWVWSTPWEVEYSLSMINEGEDAECIYLSRDEYIALKHYLARVRNYDLDTVKARTCEDALNHHTELTLPHSAPKRKGA